jgi:glycine/D-amino acid oxidase-like deaminating enzyme
MKNEHATISYWESSTWLQPDVIIIGAGIVGINAAIHLKRSDPAKKILILERGTLPAGASTKNAGFACFGSLSEIVDDLQRCSEEDVVQLIEMRWQGLQLLRDTLSDEQLEYEPLGSFEVFTDEQDELYNQSLAIMDRFNVHLEKITQVKLVFSKADHRILDFGLNGVKHLILNSAEGQINTGKMMNSLLQLARNMDITILHGVEVDSFKDNDQSVSVSTQSLGEITCKQLLIATNGFAKQLLPNIDVEPGRAQVLITSPIPHLKIKGCFHMDQGYYYFRNVGNRVLFGGGRNLDKVAETTYSHQTTEIIQKKLETYLKETILPGFDFTIEQRWAGTLGLGKTRLPIIEKIDKNVFCAVRMGGMGVAIGSLVGKNVADLMAKN